MAVEGISYKMGAEENSVGPDPEVIIARSNQGTTKNDLLSEVRVSRNQQDVSGEDVDPENVIQSDLQYGIDDHPPWYMCLLLGFQHYLTMFGATVAIPLLVAPALCMGGDDVSKSELIGTIFFVSGLVTILQSTIGNRLPIVQGGTFAFLVPVFSILNLEKWACPGNMHNATTAGFTDQNLTDANFTDDDFNDWRREIWQSRMREIQGAIIVASLFQCVIGLSGMVGLVLRYIGPLAICPTIALIGLSLFQAAADFCSKQWGIAIMTMFFIILFSQYLRNVDIPCFYYGKGEGCGKKPYPAFKLFPVILAILISWLICIILTYSGALPSEEGSMGYGARTDARLSVLNDAKWIRFPYPGQWGLPTVSVSGVFGMLAGVLAGMLESIGDYYACARLAGAPPPPVHAINRGITIEGLGCVLAGLFGTGSGTTSYSENIGAIGITKVASRRVIQIGACLMMVLGILGKFGALFVTIPDPIIGGVFMVMFGMITAVGISNLQYADLNSSRNLFVFGFSIFFGLSFPLWVSKNKDMIKTGDQIADQIIFVLLSTSMFVGGFVGFVLDNTIPGTAEERGIAYWRKQTKEANDQSGNKTSTYDFPVGMSLLRKWSWTEYIPICPTFRTSSWSRKCGLKKQRKPEGMEMPSKQS